jgi:hypothetical protein
MYLKELAPSRTKTALQVKLFVHSTLDGVEEAVNSWLERHIVQVSHVTQSQCERQGRFVFVLSVFYATD